MNEAIVAAVGTLIGAGVSLAVREYISLTRNRAELRKVERSDTLAEYKDLLERFRVELTDLRADYDGLVTRHSECERRNARAEARIEHLEEALGAAGIRFRPWSPDGSHEHRQLPPGGAKP